MKPSWGMVSIKFQYSFMKMQVTSELNIPAGLDLAAIKELILKEGIQGGLASYLETKYIDVIHPKTGEVIETDEQLEAYLGVPKKTIKVKDKKRKIKVYHTSSKIEQKKGTLGANIPLKTRITLYKPAKTFSTLFKTPHFPKGGDFLPIKLFEKRTPQILERDGYKTIQRLFSYFKRWVIRSYPKKTIEKVSRLFFQMHALELRLMTPAQIRKLNRLFETKLQDLIRRLYTSSRLNLSFNPETPRTYSTFNKGISTHCAQISEEIFSLIESFFQEGAPKVTIIIPPSTQKDLIETIEKVLVQDYSNKEIIVINAPKTTTDRFGSQILCHYGPYQSLGEAFNTAAHLSTGSYLAFLSQDTRWEKTTLKIKMEKKESLIFSHTEGLLVRKKLFFQVGPFLETEEVFSEWHSRALTRFSPQLAQ